MGDAGECQTSNKKDYDDEDDEAPPAALDEGDIALLKTYGLGPYTTSIKNIEKEINEAKVDWPRWMLCFFRAFLFFAVLSLRGVLVSLIPPRLRGFVMWLALAGALCRHLRKSQAV